MWTRFLTTVFFSMHVLVVGHCNAELWLVLDGKNGCLVIHAAREAIVVKVLFQGRLVATNVVDIWSKLRLSFPQASQHKVCCITRGRLDS